MRASLSVPLLLLSLAACSDGGGVTEPGTGQPGPGAGPFALALSDSSRTLPVGATDSVRVFVRRGPAAGAAVRLTVGTLPAGVRVEVAESLGAPDSATTLHVEVEPGATAPAEVPVELRASAGAGRETSVTLTLTLVGADAPGGAPYDAPAGAPFTLPAGIELAGPLQGMDASLDPDDPDQAGQPCAGRERVNEASGYVAVCLRLRSTRATGAPVIVRLPPGLLFMSHEVETQNGLLVWVEEIAVPAGETVEVAVMLYCASPSRGVSSSDDVFTFGPVAEHPLARELQTLLAERQALTADHHDMVQGMVWLVAEYGDRPDEVRPILAQYAAELPRR